MRRVHYSKRRVAYTQPNREDHMTVKSRARMRLPKTYAVLYPMSLALKNLFPFVTTGTRYLILAAMDQLGYKVSNRPTLRSLSAHCAGEP
jgi:hypothetical protein